jgi:hypothetical protein
VERWALAVVRALADAAATVAELIVETVPGGLAGRGTDPKTAEHPGGALFLHCAELELSAAQGGLPGEPRETEAPGHMVGGPAVSVLATDIGQAAHVHKLVPHTRPLAGAVGVGDALEGDTADLWVAVSPGWAGAHGAVVGGATDGVRSTGPRDLTGILTLPVVTESSAGTVVIGEALVRGAALPRGVSNSACGALALVGSHSVSSDGSGGTRTVLALVNVHAPVVGEDVAWLAVTLGDVVGGGAGAPAAVGDTACVHTPVVDDLADLISTTVSFILAFHLGAAQGGAGVAHMLLVTLTKCLVVLDFSLALRPQFALSQGLKHFL